MSLYLFKQRVFKTTFAILLCLPSILSIAQTTGFVVQVTNADLGAASNTSASSNNGISTEQILSSGSTDKVLLGATFFLTQGVSIKGFTISFSDSIAVLISPKVFRSSKPSFDSQAKEVTATYAIDAKSIKITFSNPIDLSTSPSTFFLKTNISNYASVRTKPIVPSLSLSSIILSQGTVSGTDISGRSYSFKDVTPPQVVSLSPANGSKNVSTSSILTIQFDEAVTLLDGKISIYTFDRKKVADLPVIAATPSARKVFNFVLNGAVPASNNYYVVISSGSSETKTGFVDTASPGNGFVGFSKITDWAFQIPDSNPPKFVITSSTATIPNLKNDIVDITLGGANIQSALNNAGKVNFLVTTSPSVMPTVAQILNPVSYSGVVIASDVFTVNQDSVLQYGSIIADLNAGTKYDVWLAATSAIGVTMLDKEVALVSFTASNPSDGAYKPLIVTYPTTYAICLGDYQSLSYPITISETNQADFVAKFDTSGSPTIQTINLLLPTGFEFDATATTTSVIKGGNDIKIESFSFVGSSVLKISFSIAGTSSRDRIIIKGLKIKATGAVGSKGNLIRLGGDALPTIADFASLGSLKTVRIPVVPFDIYDASTNLQIAGSIPTNISKASLRPHIALINYGSNVFAGDGVNGDEFSPLAAGLGQHTVKSTYTDQFGCSADTSRVITVYDFTKAVNGLDTIYNINQGPSITISKSGKGSNYRLESISASSIADLGVDPQKCFTGTDASGNVIFDPRVFNVSKNKTKSGETGSRLGTLLVVGEYRNLTTNLVEEYIQKIGLYAPPKPQITSSIVNGVVCEDAGTIQLQGTPQTSGNLVGFYTLDGVKPSVGSALTDPGDGTGIGFLNATVLASLDNLTKNNLPFAIHKIKYIIQNTKTKGSDTTLLTIKLSAKPKANFTTGVPCVGPSLVSFTNTSATPGSSTLSSFWNFGDDNASVDATSSLINPTHKFSKPKSYQVSLTVTTDLGCTSSSYTQSIKVSDLPIVNFSFTGVSLDENINFVDASSISNDVIQNRVWDFGDQSPLLNTSLTNLNHKFQQAGVYKVSLKITGSIGCSNVKTIVVGVVPKIILPKDALYSQNFEDGNDGWLTLRSPVNSNNNSSWKRVSSDPLINATASIDNGKSIWRTSNGNASYDQNEVSYLYTPAYDFSALTRPSLEFNMLRDLLSDNDGVVVQFSTDNRNIADSLKTWNSSGNIIDGNTLGIYNATNKSGYNWYNSEGLQGKPGNDSKGYGWSGVSTSSNLLGWEEGRHSLDEIDPSKRSKVVFRFALGSTNKLPKANGFALDNVRIGSRTRTVLIENFTNAGNTVSVVSRGNVEKAENNFLKDSLLNNTNFLIGTDLVKLNYHVNYPTDDPFNLDDPEDTNARALFYNITKTPLARLDGFDKSSNSSNQLFSTWANEFKLQTLKLSQADVSLSAIIIDSINSKSRGAIRINATVTAKTNALLKDITILQLAVVEQAIQLNSLSNSQQGLIKTGESNFEYVVKKLLPNASGNALPADLSIGQSKSFSVDWKPDLKKFYANSSANIGVVAFLQNAVTREVYQSAMVLNLGYPPVVTGLDETEGNEVVIFPNPVKNQFTLQLPSISDDVIEVNLINIQGEIICNKNLAVGEKSISVNTEQLSKGVYIVQLRGKARKAMYKKIMVVGE